MIAEEVVSWTSALLACTLLATVLYALWRAAGRRAGRLFGRRARWLGIPWFYLITTALFLGTCWAGWIDLPVPLPPSLQPWIFGLGGLIHFPGMLLALWARLALGRNYLTSMSLAVRLFEDHRLVITGPYGMVRHPMYLGLMLAALGTLLLYWTWTALCLAALAPVLITRARIEERVLAMEFQEEWWSYCQRVPMLIPRLLPGRGLSAPQEQL
jgi:protein-S-isoprenylcysteine O-methyltransferase Ste14